MHRIRVYVDTSVFGGTQDEEFAEPSKRFFEQVRKGKYIVLLSEETLRELAKAPENVRAAWRSLPPENAVEISTTQEAQELAQAYVQAAILGQAFIIDAVHVATATVVSADLILSWNFRHIVNFDRIRGFNAVNVQQGYRTMTILSPLEVAY